MDLAAAGMNSLRPGTVLDGERVTYGGGLQVEVRQGCPSKRNKLTATLDVRIAALLRDAGTDAGVEDRGQVLAADISTSGLLFAQAKLELAHAFLHAIRDDQDGVASRISRLRELTREGYHAYYVDIAHFMADLALDTPSRTRRLGEQQAVRQRWRTMVIDRRARLTSAPATGAP
ncbi:hypothetical protein [Streptomyces sp. NPDC055140]